MKRATIQLAGLGMLFAFAFVCLSGCGRKPKAISYSAPPSTWVAFTNKECKFSIAFPSQPKLVNHSYTNAGQTMEIAGFLAEPNKKTAFGVSVTTLPLTNKFSPEQIEIMMDSGRDKTLQTSGKPKLLREEKIVLNSNPGREFDVEKFDGKIFIRVREYLVGKRVYTLVATVPSAQSSVPDISTFLDSFRLEQ